MGEGKVGARLIPLPLPPPPLRLPIYNSPPRGGGGLRRGRGWVQVVGGGVQVGGCSDAGFSGGCIQVGGGGSVGGGGRSKGANVKGIKGEQRANVSLGLEMN